MFFPFDSRSLMSRPVENLYVLGCCAVYSDGPFRNASTSIIRARSNIPEDIPVRT
jgi:hypothetical protein